MGSKLGFGGERKLEDVGVSFALMTITQCTVAFVSIIIYMYVCIHVDIYIYLRGTLFHASIYHVRSQAGNNVR